MISAKRFAISEPVLFKATQDFVQSFAEVPDPIIYISSKARTLQSQIAWTLLGSALFQGISYTDVKRVLQGLFKVFPEEKLWTLPVPKEEDIQEIVSQTLNGTDWNIKEHVPGIFWSVGSFVRHHQKNYATTQISETEGLVQWATSRTAEEIWRDLGEIYFMGKGKPRPKAAAAIYRLTERFPLGLNIEIRKSRTQPPFPLTMGLRRYLSILGPGKYVKFSDLTADEKQKMSQELLTELVPENPAVAAHGLQFFLESGSDKFICRSHFFYCNSCPLYRFCKYALTPKLDDSRTHVPCEESAR